MKKILLTLLGVLFMLQTPSMAQKANSKVTDLPNISVIGNLVGVHSESKKSFDVNEIEFAFQHYLYPTVKADVFAALHKEDGKHNFELEESYVTFLDVFGLVAPNMPFNPGIKSIVGKKLVGIGKTNALHPEQWVFVDRPIAIKQFFGTDHGLSGEGAQLDYLLPLPFFSQIEVGYWKVAAHEEAHEGEGEGHSEAHGVEYTDNVINTRLWNSYSLSDTKEVELGLNYLSSNTNSTIAVNRQDVLGVDISYLQEMNNSNWLKLQAEYYQANYAEENGTERELQTGGYLSSYFKFSKNYQTGIRYGLLGKHGDHGESVDQISLILVRQLTETSKFRVQYNASEKAENTVLAQFIFGMGPHSHVLN